MAQYQVLKAIKVHKKTIKANQDIKSTDRFGNDTWEVIKPFVFVELPPTKRHDGMPIGEPEKKKWPFVIKEWESLGYIKKVKQQGAKDETKKE